MELLSVIRRWALRDQLSIREIARRTGLSRNTIRKYLRGDLVEPAFQLPERPSKLDAFAAKLSAWLKLESGKSRKQRRTVKQLHADLVALGFEGSYGRVAAFARSWKEQRQREQQTAGRGTFVPLVFQPGEAFQFDWSEDWAVIGSERVKLQAAHLSCATAARFSSGRTRYRRTRCCLTRILMRSGCSAACRGAASTTTCAPRWIGSASAKSARSTHALPRWPRTTCSTPIFAIRLRAGLAEVRHRSEHRWRGASREERSGRTPPAVAGDAALCHACRAKRLARAAMSGAMARRFRTAATKDRYSMPGRARLKA